MSVFGEIHETLCTLRSTLWPTRMAQKVKMLIYIPDESGSRLDLDIGIFV
jgi:hypothetical protein